MPYFPFFANIENMPCLVVGGGQVALRKIEKLLDFSPIIKVVASKACGEIRELADRGMITLFERAFNDSDIDGSTFVITATGDSGVNRHISQLCRQRHIPCNAVDEISILCSVLILSSINRQGKRTDACSALCLSDLWITCQSANQNDSVDILHRLTLSIRNHSRLPA